MPSYMSHILMGMDVLNELKKDNLLTREVNENAYRTFTLGADLASTSTKIKYNPHNKNTKIFFLELVHYIKQNHYDLDKDGMALLYGHIVHYFLDINAHPFVYYLEKDSKKVGIVPNHYLIEGYIDSYIVNKKMGVDVTKVDCTCFDKMNWNEAAIRNTINNVYGRIYGDYRMVDAYKLTLFFINFWEKFHKKVLPIKNLKVNLTGFRKFIKMNDFTYSELVNNNHFLWENPFDGESNNKSFMDLYNDSVDMSVDAIKKVNKYLDNECSISSLENVFNDISYDTGISCSKGKELLYGRKKYYKK